MASCFLMFCYSLTCRGLDVFQKASILPEQPTCLRFGIEATKTTQREVVLLVKPGSLGKRARLTEGAGDCSQA